MHLKPFARRLSLSTAFCLLGTSKKNIGVFKGSPPVFTPPSPPFHTYIPLPPPGRALWGRALYVLAVLPRPCPFIWVALSAYLCKVLMPTGIAAFQTSFCKTFLFDTGAAQSLAGMNTCANTWQIWVWV